MVHQGTTGEGWGEGGGKGREGRGRGGEGRALWPVSRSGEDTHLMEETGTLKY